MTIKAVSLKDRILWPDGFSTVSEEFIEETFARGQSTAGLCVEELTPAILQFNKMVEPEDEIHIKKTVTRPDTSFVIPKAYLDLDVDEYVVNKLILELESGRFTHEQKAIRANTTKLELLLYEKLGLLDVLRTLIYVINTLQDKNVVWGVGRGSSVASYVLYLIGVHDVDSVEYQLDIGEFLRT